MQQIFASRSNLNFENQFFAFYSNTEKHIRSHWVHESCNTLISTCQYLTSTDDYTNLYYAHIHYLFLFFY